MYFNDMSTRSGPGEAGDRNFHMVYEIRMCKLGYSGCIFILRHDININYKANTK